MADPALARLDTVDDGRAGQRQGARRIEVDAGIDEAEAERLALASDQGAEALAGAAPKKVIARPPKLVNIVV